MDSYLIKIFILLLISSSLPAQQKTEKKFTINNSEIINIDSEINGQKYELMVHLPSSYDSAVTKKYPVVYFCDGFYDFALFSAIHGSGVYDKTIPECIMIGFSYQGENPDYGKLRFHDYLPTFVENRGGGAPLFLEVVEKEFIPFIENNYRVDSSFRVLGGSSAGGIFTLYALFTKPYLFDGYMAVSPAAYYDNRLIFKLEEDFNKKNKSFPISLFISGAEKEFPERPEYVNAIKDFGEILEDRDYDDFRIESRIIEDAYHSGTKAEGYTRAMKFIFEPMMKEK